MRIKILYEDKDILVIDKPSGISVHADGRSKAETISDWFVKKYPKAKNVGEPIFIDNKEIKKPGIVHRLDRETSGVLLLAKNQKAFEFLKLQFQNREVKKFYNALVWGWPRNDRGTVSKAIGRSPSDFRKRLAGRGARGELREAVTEYSVLKRLKDKKGVKFSFIEARPKTGRTHQIRVHMKFLNFPVLCDSLYDSKNTCPKSLGRLALHAREIVFKKLDGEKIRVSSELPEEMKKMVE